MEDISEKVILFFLMHVSDNSCELRYKQVVVVMEREGALPKYATVFRFEQNGLSRRFTSLLAFLTVK